MGRDWRFPFNVFPFNFYLKGSSRCHTYEGTTPFDNLNWENKNDIDTKTARNQSPRIVSGISVELRTTQNYFSQTPIPHKKFVSSFFSPLGLLTCIFLLPRRSSYSLRIRDVEGVDTTKVTYLFGIIPRNILLNYGSDQRYIYSHFCCYRYVKVCIYLYISLNIQTLNIGYYDHDKSKISFRVS